MASIKVDSVVVKRSCVEYLVSYANWKNSYKPDANDDGAWIEDKCKSNNASTVKQIKAMAQAVGDTQYPYVTLSEKDFMLIGRYLGKNGNY